MEVVWGFELRAKKVRGIMGGLNLWARDGRRGGPSEVPGS